MVAVHPRPFETLWKTPHVFHCRTSASYGQNVVNPDIAIPIYYCYYILLAIILCTTFLIHVPFTAQPQPPPFTLVALLSRFLLRCLCTPTLFLPNLDRSKTEFLRLLNA